MSLDVLKMDKNNSIHGALVIPNDGISSDT